MTKVLVIDDEKQVLEMLCTICRRKNYEVVAASNGQEGLRKLDSENPDIVITDLFMDVQDGLGTIMGIKKRDGNVPIIAISGGGWTTGTDYLSVARKMGVERTFTKPVANRELVAAIEDLTS